MMNCNNEKRACGCNSNGNQNMTNGDCDYTPDGINAAFGYNTASEMDDMSNEYMMDNNCGCKEKTREEMIQKIKELNFAIIELGLYLDTHSDDRKALCLHREYTKELKELKDQYQKVYGPLSIYYPCNKWRWLEEPWASFILEEGFLSTKCNTI